MNPAQLLSHFDRIGEAPDAIPRLRRFILDLAVRGKLVEQDPRDEPASELLKLIQAEKARLVMEGKARKEKPFPSIAEDDLPFQVPKNWSWSQLAEIGFINPRNTAIDDLPSSFVPMPLISADYRVGNKHEIRPWGEMKSGYTHFAENDVALAKITPCFENGKSTVFRGLTGGIGAGTTELHVVRPVTISADYVLIFLKCPHFIESGIPRMTGTAGQKRVPTEYFAYSPFSLPPLAEQHRIVAKVDELMALCDRLETAQTERESRRNRLVAASLHHLNNGADADAFQEHARFYFNHLPRLTTRPDHLKQLRQTILNLAVRGKLVEQDPNDELAEKLLKAPKKAEGKKPKWAGPIEQQEEPFQLPSSCSWLRLGEVAGLKHGYAFSSEFFTSEPTSFVLTTPGNFYERGGFRDRESKRKYYSGPVDPEFIFKPGDLIIPMTEQAAGLLGSPAFIPDDGRVYIHNQRLGKLSFPEWIASEFAFWFFNCEFFRGELARNCTGMKVRHTSPDRILRVPFPVFPLGEQRRIVAKVDELMALCDQLETQLTTTQSESRLLLEALLHELLSSRPMPY